LATANETERRRRGGGPWNMSRNSVRTIRTRGIRYRRCRLSNYKIYDEPGDASRQQSVLAAVQDYQARVGQNLAEGCGLMLFGPCGTGKDHLLAAVIWEAIHVYRADVLWIDGVDLYGWFRDRIDDGELESELVARFTTPEVLAISDPLPPFGELTRYQAEMLMRIFDHRYRHMRAVCTTINVEDRDELDTRITPQVAERLVDGNVCLFCDWKSYRKSRRRG